MLERLDRREQQALMEMLIALAKSDGQVKNVEREVLEEYAELVGVDFASLSGDKYLEDLVEEFERPESRVIVLQELLRLAHLDGLFAEEEQEDILYVAELMGVPVGMVKKIETWVVDGLKWVWRGEALLDEAAEKVR